MKKHVLYTAVIVGFVLFGIGHAALAQSSKFYASGFIGLNIIPDLDLDNTAASTSGELDLDDTVSFGGALGFRLSRSLSVEAEVSYRSSDADTLSLGGTTASLSGDVDVLSLMLNGKYTFDVDWLLKPYFTAGAGIGFFDGDLSDGGAALIQDSSDSSTGFVYQVGGGLQYRFDDDLALTGSYRYFGSEDIDFDETEIDYESHELRLGLEYELPFGWDLPE